MLNFFGVKVKQTGDYVHVTGVSYYNLAKDIQNYFSSNLVTKYMIRKETFDSTKVHNFFLVELHFILGKLLQLKTLRSRRRELVELKQLLETETWLKDTLNPIGRKLNLKKLDRFKTKPYPKQVEFLENYGVITNSYHLKGLLLDAKPGSGKAQPLDTMVKVPGGWSRLGDLKIGDAVIGPRGNAANIVATFPQGITDVYRFILEDGRQVDSHPDHLWQVYADDSYEPSIVTTREIVENFAITEFALPLVEELGGNVTTTDICFPLTADAVIASTDFIDAGVTELAYNERFALLKVIIEKAHTIITEDTVHVYLEREMAAVNFQFLMWSIGGIARLDLSGPVPFVEIKHANIGGLIRKLVDENPGVEFELNKYLGLKVNITKVMKMDPEETLCISIDSEDKLYIVDDYVVTHNTLTSYMWSELFSDNKTLVVCPLVVLEDVWVEQANKHFVKPPRIWTSKSGRLLTPDYDYYIVNYEYLRGEGLKLLTDFMKKTIKDTGEKFKLVVDEIQNFADTKAKQTINLISLSDENLFEGALPGSGTALKALGSEIFTVLCLIDEYFDGRARDFFKNSYGRNRQSMTEMLSNRIGRGKFTIPELQGMGEPTPFEIVKVQIPNGDQYTLDAIKLKMQTYIAERVTFYNRNMPDFINFYNEVISEYENSLLKNPKELADLQKYKTIVHRFRTKGYSSFHDSADSLFCKSVEESIEARLSGKELQEFRNVKSAVKYLGLKLRGEALGNVLGKARIDATRELIAHANLSKYIDNVEKKTVIFTSYVDALHQTEDYLKTKGYNTVIIYGQNINDRERLLDQFRNNPQVNPLATTYDSLKEGVPLTAANQILSLNAPWRDYEIKQVQARIWRQGQDSDCFFYMFDLDTGNKLNIMTRSINILEWSREQVEALMSRLEGHQILNTVSGNELLDLSEESDTDRIRYYNSVLTLF